jgi:CDP-glycerol glycerophosphotransferase
VSGSAPDVTVIMAVHNDVPRLPRALRSLSRQTLGSIEFVIVDDASTDGSYEFALRVAEQDPRFRVFRMDRNSGGFAAPRNRGLVEARGGWVLFCDSDDELEIHAAKNLLLAAERRDADLSAGVTELVEQRSGKRQRVQEWAHQTEGASSLAQRAALLSEASTHGRLYRRERLQQLNLSFDPELVTADFLFASAALLGSEDVALVSETVYLRHVDRLGEELTSGRRRWLIRHLGDRLEALRRVDALIAAQPDAQHRYAATLRFLNEDLAVYLSVILDSDDTSAVLVADQLREYLGDVSLDPAADIAPLLRVALYHLLIDDLDGIRRAMRFIRWAASVDGTVHMRDGRELWVCTDDHPLGEVAGHETDWWLDVTLQGLSRIPLTQRRYCHQLTSVTDDRLHGSTSDFLDSLSEVTAARVVVLGEGRVVAAAPVEFEQVTPVHWEWSTTQRLKPIGSLELGDRGFLGIELTFSDRLNTSVVRASEVRAGTTMSIRVSALRREGLHLEERGQGIVGWRLIRRSVLGLAAAGLRKGWFAIPGTRALAARWQRFTHITLPKVARRMGEYLPDRRAFVIASDHGRQLTGHPRAIAEYLHAEESNARLRWLGSRAAITGLDWLTHVDPSTVRGAWRIARAGYWIDDFGIDTSIRKSRRTKYLQTWHGIALKRVGADAPDWPLLSPRVRMPRPTNRERWDALLSPSEFFAETTAQAIGFTGPLIESCSPVGDAIMRSSSDRLLRDVLDLPLDRPVIVYAPTARTTDEMRLDLAAWWRDFGNSAYLLVRSHPADPLVVPARWANGIRDISAEGDFASYLGAAEALLTDYSAVAFDFARLGRPIGFFVPDYERFTRRSVGLYLDLATSGPGPLLRNTDELTVWMQALIEATPTGGFDTDPAGHRDFVSMFAGELDGTSARRAIDHLRGMR